MKLEIITLIIRLAIAVMTGICIPAFKSWYTDPVKFASWADNKYHGDDFRALIPDLVTNCTATRSIYYVKNSDAVGNVIYSALDQCYLNNKPVRDVVKDLDQKAKPYLQGVWENTLPPQYDHGEHG